MRDLEHGRPHGKARADHELPERDARHGEVLAERCRFQRTTQLAGPPLVVLDGVRVHGLVGSTMHSEVGLLVAVEVDSAHCLILIQ